MEEIKLNLHVNNWKKKQRVGVGVANKKKNSSIQGKLLSNAARTGRQLLPRSGAKAVLDIKRPQFKRSSGRKVLEDREITLKRRVNVGHTRENNGIRRSKKVDGDRSYQKMKKKKDEMESVFLTSLNAEVAAEEERKKLKKTANSHKHSKINTKPKHSKFPGDSGEMESVFLYSLNSQAAEDLSESPLSDDDDYDDDDKENVADSNQNEKESENSESENEAQKKKKRRKRLSKREEASLKEFILSDGTDIDEYLVIRHPSWLHKRRRRNYERLATFQGTHMKYE